MQDRHILILTVVSFIVIAACRVRNDDRRFRKVEAKNILSRILLFPVAIYDQTTVMSGVICIGLEILFFFSMLAIYVLKIQKNLVCYFWAALIFFTFMGSAACEAFIDWKYAEEKRKKTGYMVATIAYGASAVTFLIIYILKFFS